jgi:hypothetical protein
MKKFKDLNACIADLEAVLSRNYIKSQQKQDVEATIEEVKRIRRKPTLSRPEAFRAVRQITERLIRAFLKKN